MSKDDEKIDLRLALGSTNNRNQRSSKNSSGAGVNANSRVDMVFAASDPLAELVWSPDNGLSLKCTDLGLAAKKPFLLWNVGQSSKCHSTSQSFRSRGSEDKQVDDGLTLNMSLATLNAESKYCDKAILLRSPSSSHGAELGTNHGLRDEADGKMEEIREADDIYKDQSVKNDKDNDICSPQNFEIADVAQSSKENAGQDAVADDTRKRRTGMSITGHFCTELISRVKKKRRTVVNGSSSDNICLDITMHTGLHATSFSEAPVCFPMSSLSLQEPDKEVTSAAEEVCTKKLRMPILATPLKRLESSAENDLGHTAKEFRSLNEMQLQTENILPVERSPTNSGTRLYREKGKKKALSDGDMYERLSNEENDSHETVESCNSAGFIKGIKRQNSGQELISESNRMKTQIQGSYIPTPVFGPHSSFMNWISNMVKGVPNSSKDDPSSSTLALVHSNDGDAKNLHEDITLNKTRDSANQSRGFRNMFQSLYRGNTKTVKGGVEESYSTEGSKELLVVGKSSAENLQRHCDSKIDHSCKQIAASNKEANPNISREIVRHPMEPMMLSADVPSTSYACESNLAKSKASKAPVCIRERGFLSPFDSPWKQFDSTSDGRDVDIPLTTSKTPEKVNPFSSLWITRLYTKSPMLETCNMITQETDVLITECSNENTKQLMNDGFSISHKTSDSKDVYVKSRIRALEKEKHVFASNAMASVDLNSSCNTSPMESPQKFKSSEAIASVFARQLDAFRHVVPSETRTSPSCIDACFFCGKMGHDLHECPEITEIELEDLAVKVRPLRRVEESPRFCLKCCQLGHWAISCPLASSRTHLQLEKNASLISHCSANSQQLGNVKHSSYQFLTSFPGYLSSNATGSSSKRCRSSHKTRNVTASGSIFPMYNSIAAHNAVAPVYMSQVIRKLRLSRVDILRWMNSDVSVAHLSGFFLRLRLGKLEAGLGKASYYVARITGDVNERLCRKSKRLILVDVGGIQSSVESPYISNHDFLEDEIGAWWSKIMEAGGRIPSLGELNAKLDDRRNLGL